MSDLLKTMENLKSTQSDQNNLDSHPSSQMQKRNTISNSNDFSRHFSQPNHKIRGQFSHLEEAFSR